jgi:O-Antigen ligase
VPGAMIAAGLICTVTRSAWLGTVFAFPFLATIMGQTRRLLRYAGIALALFLLSIPVLGLGDYLFSTKKGQDPSAEEHVEQIGQSFDFMASHPLGVGPGNAGRWALENKNAFFVDDTYLTFASEYGVLNALCFIGFLVTALRLSWRQRTQLGYASAGILVGFAVVMTFFIAHDVFPLACWIWFPIGLAIRSGAP